MYDANTERGTDVVRVWTKDESNLKRHFFFDSTHSLMITEAAESQLCQGELCVGKASQTEASQCKLALSITFRVRK